MKLVTIVLFTAVALATGNWQQLGPNGAAITALTPVPGYPDELYIAVGSFPTLIFHTTDAGLSWGTPETIPDIITALTINPNNIQTLYAGGKTRRIYKSTNAGATWQVVANLPSSYDLWVQQIVVNPSNSNELWAAAETYSGDSIGIYLLNSTDAGATWNLSRVINSFEARARLLAINPANPGTGFIGGSVANRARVFYTTDYGASWQDKSSGLGGRCAYALAFSPANSSTVICATDTGIFHSFNLGSDWTRRLTAPTYAIAFSPTSPYYAYAGGENLVYRSTDLGLTWNADTTLFTGTNTRWLAPVRPLEVYAGNSYGIFYSTNGGYDWTYRTPGLKHLRVLTLNFSIPETVFACVEGVGVMKTSARNQNWQPWGKRFPGSAWIKDVAVNPRHPDTIVCVTTFDSRLHRTINRGDSWETPLIAQHFEPQGIAYHPAGSDTLYTWGGKRDSSAGPLRFAIMRSTDQGQTWNTVMLRDPGLCLGMYFSRNADTIFAFGKTGSAPALFRSIDRGRNWTLTNTGITGTPVTDLKRFPGNGAIWFCTTPAGVFKSENNGLTWTTIGLNGTTCVLPDTAISTRVWAGTDTQGVFYTTNNGIIWNRDTLGIAGRTNSFIMRHPDNTSAVYLGVYGFSLAGKNVFGIEEPAFIPKTKPELQIFPTPITRYVRIVAPRDIIRLELYNATGRLVQIIPIPQNHSGPLLWQRPENLGAGVYMLKARGNNQQEIVKLILLR
ncbi:T9SS type A sorting domain-containing protein [candidate division WOR-3 bacterium]|nr:T9SS type A sorting domain-containing protein [candidate division WOR-3 bacterium]